MIGIFQIKICQLNRNMLVPLEIPFYLFLLSPSPGSSAAHRQGFWASYFFGDLLDKELRSQDFPDLYVHCFLFFNSCRIMKNILGGIQIQILHDKPKISA